MLLVLVLSWLLGMLLTPSALWPALVTGFLFCLIAVYTTCLGLLFSLKSQTTLRAMGQTLGTLVFFGGGYLFCCCTVMMGGGGDAWELCLALCIPFLLVFPGIAYMSFDQADYFLNHSAVTVSFILGTLIHMMAAAVLYAHTVANFDRYAGRTIYPEYGRSGPAHPATVDLTVAGEN
jgi:hypothetical protein